MKVDVAAFEVTQGQIESLHEEVGVLSKKKPDDAINKFKLRLINKVLSSANTLLETEYIPFADFKQFDEEDLPTNSDVVLVLAQYLSCFKRQYHDRKYWEGLR